MTCERAVTPKTIEHQHALVKTLQHAVAVAHDGSHLADGLGDFVRRGGGNPDIVEVGEARHLRHVGGLILRAVGNYGLPDALRLTVGPAEACQLVVAALKDFMGQ